MQGRRAKCGGARRDFRLEAWGEGGRDGAMKRRTMNKWALGLLWLASLGAMFGLGLLSAFTVHTLPGEGTEAGVVGANERMMLGVLERYSGVAVDIGAYKAAGDDGMPESLNLALRGLLRESDPDWREAGLAVLADTLPSRNVMAALRMLGAMEAGPGRDRALWQLMERWGREDGRRAVAFAAQMARPAERRLLQEAALTGWAVARPADAWSWAVERSRGVEGARRYLEPILRRLAMEDGEAAIERLSALEDEAVAGEMSVAVVEGLLHRERPEQVARWMDVIPAQMRPQAVVALAERWGRDAPLAALDYLDAKLGLRIETAGNLLADIAYDDGQVAADYVLAAATAGERAALLGLVADNWIAGAGPAALAAWLNANGPADGMDMAIEALAYETARTDVETALVWAQMLSDGQRAAQVELSIGEMALARLGTAALPSLERYLQSEMARAYLLGEVSGAAAAEVEDAAAVEDGEAVPPAGGN